jgi:hypothetical protein
LYNRGTVKKAQTYIPGKYNILMEVLLGLITDMHSLKGDIDLWNIKPKCCCISCIDQKKNIVIISGSFVSSIIKLRQGDVSSSRKTVILCYS